MSEPIINQPWEDVASDVTDAIEKAVQPLLKKATDEIYAGLLDTTQDYLRDNLAFNIADRIDAAERQADHDRRKCEQLGDINRHLLAALTALRNEVSGKSRPQVLIPLLGDADRAIARATGAGA